MARPNKKLTDGPSSSYDSANVEAIQKLVASLPEPLRENAQAFLDAAAILGRSQSASGSWQAADRALVAWARDSGRLVADSEFSTAPISNHTSEHEVWLKDGRALKRTWAGFYGQIPAMQGETLDRRNATPAEYLQRMALQIAVFQSDIRLEGVNVSDKPSMIIGQPAGRPSLVISQGWLVAKNPQAPYPTMAGTAERGRSRNL
jgi:hypothetical protein